MGKKAPPFGDNCARRTKRPYFLDVYPVCLYEYPSNAVASATSSATFGVTYLGKFDSDNQTVKCQVCRVSPPVDVESLNPSGFVRDAADMNHDGVVNIVDVTIIIDGILKGK